jgi:hypothetical protein
MFGVKTQVQESLVKKQLKDDETVVLLKGLLSCPIERQSIRMKYGWLAHPQIIHLTLRRLTVSSCLIFK